MGYKNILLGSIGDIAWVYDDVSYFEPFHGSSGSLFLLLLHIREEIISQLSRLGFLSSLCIIYEHGKKKKIDNRFEMRDRKKKTPFDNTTNGFSHIPVMMHLHEINSSITLFQPLEFFNQYIRRIVGKGKKGIQQKWAKTKKSKKENKH